MFFSSLAGNPAASQLIFRRGVAWSAGVKRKPPSTLDTPSGT
jgi:hypothetical protein